MNPPDNKDTRCSYRLSKPGVVEFRRCTDNQVMATLDIGLHDAY